MRLIEILLEMECEELRAPIESSRIELLPGLELDSKIRIESRINIRPFPNHATGN